MYKLLYLLKYNPNKISVILNWIFNPSEFSHMYEEEIKFQENINKWKK